MQILEPLAQFAHKMVGILDSPGGHILCGFALITMGITSSNEKAWELVIAGSTIVGMGAKGLNGKGAQQ